MPTFKRRMIPPFCAVHFLLRRYVSSALRRIFGYSHIKFLSQKELAWWATNRSISVTSPYTNTTHTMYRYAVNNSAPRPESYLTDYLTANDPSLATPLTESERADLYAELASGAESGWDYSSRWEKNFNAAGTDNQLPGLRTLNVRGTIPVDLNSILCTRLFCFHLYWV